MSPPHDALEQACQAARLPGPATLIRLGENAVYRLPGGVVARVARPGAEAAARLEVRLARWLATQHARAARPLPLAQPVMAAGRAVTFWEDLGPHREGQAVEVAQALRHLHQLPPPPASLLPAWEPFARLDTRLNTAAPLLSPHEQAWLREHTAKLREQCRRLPPGLGQAPLHGDARGANIVVTSSGVTLIDLESATLGPPEWDLTSATHKLNVGWHTPADYAAFRDRYGHDVTTWAGYETLRDIRELRETTFALQQAADNPAYLREARHRLACLRGEAGPRPWRWAPL